MNLIFARSFKLLTCLTVLSFSFTSSLLIADAEITKEQNKSGVRVAARFLPEVSYSTRGFTPLSLHITNDSDEPLDFSRDNISLSTASSKVVFKGLKIKNLGSAAFKGALLGAGTTVAAGTALYFGMSGFLIQAVPALTLYAILPAAFIGAFVKMTTQRLKRKKIERKIKRLAFTRKKIPPHCEEEIVVFVRNEDRNRNFSFELDKQGKSEQVSFSF